MKRKRTAAGATSDLDPTVSPEPAQPRSLSSRRLVRCSPWHSSCGNMNWRTVKSKLCHSSPTPSAKDRTASSSSASAMILVVILNPACACVFSSGEARVRWPTLAQLPAHPASQHAIFSQQQGRDSSARWSWQRRHHSGRQRPVRPYLLIVPPYTRADSHTGGPTSSRTSSMVTRCSLITSVPINSAT